MLGANVAAASSENDEANLDQSRKLQKKFGFNSSLLLNLQGESGLTPEKVDRKNTQESEQYSKHAQLTAGLNAFANVTSTAGASFPDLNALKTMQSRQQNYQKSLAAKVKDRLQQEEQEPVDSLSNSSLGTDDENDPDGSRASTTRKLNRIEKKIQQPNLSKKERRLLQNRKSALKCRLKKQDQLANLKGKVDVLVEENGSLKEHVSTSTQFQNFWCVSSKKIFFLFINHKNGQR